MIFKVSNFIDTLVVPRHLVGKHACVDQCNVVGSVFVGVVVFRWLNPFEKLV